MVVVVIVAILMAVAVPGLAGVRRSNLAIRAAHEVLRIAKRARAEAVGRGAAHMVRYTALTGRGTSYGQVELWRGDRDRCNAVDWDAIRSAGACPANPNCLDEADMRTWSTEGASGTRRETVVQLRAPGLGGRLDVCYQPDGRMLWRSGRRRRFSERNVTDTGQRILGAVRFRVRLLRGSTPVGVDRWVVLPLGGEPRMAR